MAYSSWATPSKTSGSGNADVDWSGSINTGRNARSTTPKVSASGANDVPLVISQGGKPEFVAMDDAGAVSKDGGTLTIAGVSNSSKLTFSLANNNIGLTLPTNYTANGVSARSGTAISGDPGGSQEFNFSISFSNIAANASTSPKTTQLTVTDNAGHSDTCLITQAAGDVYLRVSPTTIELDWEGNPVTMRIESNASWTIS